MIILDTFNFTEHQTTTGTFYIRGRLQFSLQELGSLLDNNENIPYLPGNFCFVYKNHKQEFHWATDSISSHPLFYSDHYISSNYSVIYEKYKDSFNEEFFIDRMWLHGYTVGHTTSSKKISRALPGYIFNPKAKVYYGDLIDCPSPRRAYNPQQYLELLENLIEKQSRQQENTLLLSAGKDSAVIAGLIVKMKLTDRFRFVTLYSDKSPNSEISQVRTLCRELGLTLIEHKVQFDKSDFVVEKSHLLWKENPFYFKRTSIKDLQLEKTKVWTGEVNVLNLTDFSPILYALQQFPHLSHDNLVSLRLSLEYLRMHSTARMSFENLPNFLSTKEKEQSFLRISNYLIPLWKRLSHLPLYSRVQIFTGFDTISHRLYSYNQDPEIHWYHPFSNEELCRMVYHMDERYKIGPQGEIKYILYLLAKDFINVDRVWSLPKQGLGIPAKDKIKKDKDEMD